MKKLLSLLLAFCFVTVLFSETPHAFQVVKFNKDVSAVVLQVIDGDSLLVRTDGGETGYVRLAGIKSLGYDGSLNYVTTELLGARVSLVYDPYLAGISELWSYMHVYKSNTLISETLLKNGLAIIDESQNTTMYNSTFLSAEKEGRLKRIGLWASGIYYDGMPHTSLMININLATADAITEHLDGVSLSVANNIVKHRNNSPFAIVSDIKFVTGFTDEMYNKNRYMLTVLTDINTAPEDELATIQGISASTASRISAYRTVSSFEYIDDLTENRLLTTTQFNNIKNFIDIEYRDYVIAAVPDTVVNVNTATRTQLTETGMTSAAANQIIAARKNGYTIKYVGELSNISTYFTVTRINNFYDNLNVYTNINTATKKELVSLFGGVSGASSAADTIIKNRPYRNMDRLRNVLEEKHFDQIQPYIYIDSYEMNYININTATRFGLIAAGFTASEASEIIAAGVMKSSSSIPFDISSLNNFVTLYTNINKASKEELLSLSSLLTSSVADGILEYTADRPFGDINEVETYFRLKGISSVFRAIEPYIVLR